uniref:Uncharacterized protein n=1 Tax=Timema genevievae TaxID=629358 RepID=A0A7R9K864_TIMGE|nr:unnamed protein product [Timema genevievae]
MKEALKSIDKQQQQYSELSPEQLQPDFSIPITFTKAVVFVVDSSNQERLLEAHSELTKLMSEKELKDASLLILANKQDVPDCVTIEDLTKQFALYKLCCGRSWHIQACDAQSGTGLHDGLDWLSRQLVAAGVYDIT